MNTKQVTLVCSMMVFLATSCNTNSFDYKYADKEDTIACNNASVNTELIKEALYSFEAELFANYARNTTNLQTAYSFYMGTALHC